MVKCATAESRWGMKRRNSLRFWVAPSFLGAVGTAALTAIAWSQSPEPLPTVEVVLDRYVQATGGAPALLRHKSMTIWSRTENLTNHANVQTVVYCANGKLLQKTTLPENKEFLAGYDGLTAWQIDGSGKVSIAHGDVVKTVARDADMYYHLHVLKYFRSMEVADGREFNGRACYHLKGVNNWGKLNEQFYDKENGLLLGYAFNTAWRGGKGDATVTFEDYKEFGGVLLPTKTTSRDGDAVSVDLVESVTFDDVADSVFTLPEAVRKAILARGALSP
jgi:hypothetical protein